MIDGMMSAQMWIGRIVEKATNIAKLFAAFAKQPDWNGIVVIILKRALLPPKTNLKQATDD